MKGSEYVFNYVCLLYYKSHKINPNCGGSYIDSPDWIKNKKSTINPVNKKRQMFSVPCNSRLKSWRNQQQKKKTQRKVKIKPFINKYN